MGRYIGPACRLCRREGMKLFLKGTRCYLAKCAIDKERNPPGQHGARRRKLSDYGEQLRAKQRLRRTYGMQEKQFRVFFEKALKRRGVTGERLLQMLEMRLDTVVWRLGFAVSQRAARQMVLHGHIEVNGRKVDIPSFQLRPGWSVQVRSREASRDLAKTSLDQVASVRKSEEVVPWLSLSRDELKGEVLHVPTRDEIQPIVNEQQVVELYSK